jgi:hypothetical protein
MFDSEEGPTLRIRERRPTITYGVLIAVGALLLVAAASAVAMYRRDGWAGREQERGEREEEVFITRRAVERHFSPTEDRGASSREDHETIAPAGTRAHGE